MRRTTPLEKLSVSVINAAIVLVLSLPFLYLWGPTWQWKIATIILFLLYNLFFLVFNDSRCVGSMLIHTYWEKPYPTINHVAHLFLYTLSFSTLFFWIWFPFDVLVFNLLLLQLPCVVLTGTTLHGFLSGRMITVRSY